MRTAAVFLVLAAIIALVERQPNGPAAATTSDSHQLQWVRTAEGWECPAHWDQQIRPRPQLSPLVVAGGQVLGSILALLAFSEAPTGSGVVFTPQRFSVA